MDESKQCHKNHHALGKSKQLALYILHDSAAFGICKSLIKAESRI